MRVIILTQYYPPEVGAPQMRLSALAAGLAGRGFDVTVHTCPPHYPDGVIKAPHRNRRVTVEDDGPIRIVRSAVYPAPNRGVFRRLASQASFGASALASAGAAGRADVVIAETPPLFVAGAAIGYARRKRAPLVLNVSDLWPESAIELGALRSPLAIGAARRLESAAYRAAAAVTCPTEGLVAALARHPDAREKVRRIAPGVDLEAFAQADPDGDLSASRPLRVLYAGTIGMAQGVGTLVEAARLLEDEAAVEVTIAGDGAEAGAIAAAARKLPNVNVIGAVPHERVPSLYANADAAVVLLRDLPLFQGALPTKMFEAMAAGRPVVLAARGEAGEVIKQSGGGIAVPPEDPAALANALRELAADPARARQLGRSGRRWVERDFGWERAVEAWSDLLAEVADSKASPG